MNNNLETNDYQSIIEEQEEKVYLIDWLKEHKKEIKDVVTDLGKKGALVVAAYLLGRNANKEKLNQLKNIIDNLIHDNETLNNINNKLEFENIMLKASIAKSAERHNLKDEIMKKVMSDGLRYGSPEAARQMAYKKHNAH